MKLAELADRLEQAALAHERGKAAGGRDEAYLAFAESISASLVVIAASLERFSEGDPVVVRSE